MREFVQPRRYVRIAFCASIALLVSACDTFVNEQTWVERGREHLDNGAYSAATSDLKHALERNPQNPTARAMMAELSLRLGDLSGAELELNKAARAGASEDVLRPLRYDLFVGLRRFEELTNALEGEQATPPAKRLVLQSFVDSAHGEAQAAEQKVRAALDASPNDPEALIELARLTAARGDLTGALELVGKVTQPDAMVARAELVKASVLIVRGAYAEARTALIDAQTRGATRLSIPEQLAIATALTEANLALNDADAAERSLGKLGQWAPYSVATHHLRARLAMLRNDPVTAIAECQKGLQGAPDYVPTQMLLAAVHMSRGSLNQAEQIVSEVLAKHPDNLGARKLLGQIYLSRNQPQQAAGVLNVEGAASDAQLDWLLGTALLQGGDASGLARLERSLAALPDDVGRRIELAQAYIATGTPAKAIPLLKTVPSGSPLATRAQRLLVLASISGRAPAEARKEVDALVAEHPQDASLLAAAGAYLAAAGDAVRGKALLERATAADPKANDARRALAVLAARSGDLAQAQRELEAILATDPREQQARVGLSELAWAKGDRAGARKALEDAIGADPGATEARLRLAQIAFIEGDPGRGRDLLTQAASVSTDKAATLSGAGHVLARAGLTDEAIARYGEAAIAGSSEAVVSAARLHLEAERFKEARQLADSVAADRPNWLDAQRLVIEIDARSNKVDQALARARSLARTASSADRRELDGDVYLLARQPDKAEAAYVEAYRSEASGGRAIKIFRVRTSTRQPNADRMLVEWLERTPADANVRRLLAANYEATGKRADAEREYERLLADNRIDPVSLNNLAWLLHEQGNARALDLARRAHDAAPGIPEIADTYGWILVQMNKVPEGRSVLERALAAAPTNSDIQYHAATAYARSGQRERAAELLREALRADGKPWRDEARRLLESLKTQG